MSTFRFQQFSVIQKQSAMKVCTDAVLFGAMAPVQEGDRVLDIGAGTGVLSLMRIIMIMNTHSYDREHLLYSRIG